ncbi:MAG: hypothetical protein V1846_00920 [Candidatus Komeilibacteria bacterium]
MKKIPHVVKVIGLTLIIVLVVIILVIIWGKKCYVYWPAIAGEQEQYCAVGRSLLSPLYEGLDFIHSPEERCYSIGQGTHYGAFSKYTCRPMTKDAGKPCTDVSQCEYSCFYEPINGVFGDTRAEKLKNIIGYCSYYLDSCDLHWVVRNGTAYDEGSISCD